MTRSTRDPVLCAFAYVAAFLLLASVLLHRSGFPLDDSWIHQVIARNLAQTHRLGFVPGQLTAGSTSLLWSFLLALFDVLLPHASPVVVSLSINMLLLAGIGYALKAITQDDAFPPAASWAFTLAPLASGNFLWFGLIGMEHLLFILLSLCLIRQWMRPSSQRRFSDLPLLALVAFLLVLTRPEGLFLALPLLLTLRLAQRPVRSLFAVSAGVLCAGLVLAATNWLVGHRLLPQTMQGRQFLYRVSTGSRFDFLGQIVARCLKTWSFFYERSLLHGRGIVAGIPLVVLLAALAVLALRRLFRLHACRTLLLCSWAVLIVLLYLVMLPSIGHGGRYLSLPLMLFLPLELLGLQALFAGVPSLRRHAWSLTALIALVAGVFSLRAWRQATVAQVAQIESEHGAMATWLIQNLPPDAIAQRQIAVFDIGRIGYQLNGRLVDLGGLIDPVFLDAVTHGRTTLYLARHNVRYMVLPSAVADDSADFAGRLQLGPAYGVHLVPMHSICVDARTDALAESSAITAYACQRAYRLVYN